MRLRAYRNWTVLAALVGLGCRTPPAQLAGCDGPSPSRRAAVVRQVAVDTAVSAAARPARSLYAGLTEPGAYLSAWGAGLIEKRITLRRLGSPPPICLDRGTLDTAALEAIARRVSKVPASPADVRLYIDGEDARSALAGVIASATCRIDVLMYLWGDDTIGWEVARQLASKASPCLPVRVLIDGGGNLSQGEPKEATTAEVNRAVCWLSEQPCVTVIRTRDPLFRLDHRKLVVADNCVAWSGGRNFVDEAFFESHDLSYTIAGPLVAEMAETFDDFWQSQGGSASLATATPDAAIEANAEARLVRTTPTR